ncbi:MAG: hypothetical protein NZ730_06665 [Porticoccaceae bacterium]|nr:hypothetical protein [Porticoccaceae bacterium]
MKRPKQPKPTAYQKAMERRQVEALDTETAESESRLKAQARGTLGGKSLLGGAPPEAPTFKPSTMTPTKPKPKLNWLGRVRLLRNRLHGFTKKATKETLGGL